MGKLIDADALIFDLKTSFMPQSMDYTNALAIALRWLREAPEAVVRCKDCDYYGPQKRSPRWDSKAPHCTRSATIKVSPDDYCSYGKRRNEE